MFADQRGKHENQNHTARRAAEIHAIIAEMKRAGRAILLVEQNVFQALTICDRFIAIERGQVVLTGAAGSLADRDKLLSTTAV